MIVEISIKSSSFPAGSCGLGDAIAIVYALENLGRQRGIRFGVCFDGIFDPIEPFFLNHVFRSNGGLDLVGKVAERRSVNQDFGGLFFGGFFIPSVLDFMVVNFGYEPLASLPIRPKVETSRSDIVFAQMDGRCARVQGRDISTRQKKNIVSKTKNVRLLGGPETERYLGEEYLYEKANFLRATELMASAKMFVGTDSGMSHLAGFMGIRSKVYVLGNIESLKTYYRMSYRNCEVVGLPIL